MVFTQLSLGWNSTLLLAIRSRNLIFSLELPLRIILPQNSMTKSCPEDDDFQTSLAAHDQTMTTVATCFAVFRRKRCRYCQTVGLVLLEVIKLTGHQCISTNHHISLFMHFRRNVAKTCNLFISWRMVLGPWPGSGHGFSTNKNGYRHLTVKGTWHYF